MTDPTTKPTWTITTWHTPALCGALGAFGVLSGFAVFVLLRHEGEHLPFFFAVSLFVAAIVSGIIEMTRDLIKHGEIHPHELAPSRMLVTILTLATFELFVTAWHVLPGVWHEIAGEIPAAVLGPQLAASAGATAHLIALGALWVVVGVALAAALSLLVTEDEKGNPIPPGGTAIGGALAGLVLAPAVVLAFLVVARTVGILWQMVADRAAWRGVMESLVALRFAPIALPAQFVLWLDLTWHFAFLWPLVTIAVFVALAWHKRWLFVVALLIFVAPYLQDLGNLLGLLGLAALVFGLPGAVLGALTPLLRKPSAMPSTWALVAFVAGALLMALSLLGVTTAWFTVPGLVLIGTGILFRRVARIEEYWPLLALAVGLGLFGTSAVLQQATFRGVFSKFHGVATLSSTPLVEPAADPVPSGEVSFADRMAVARLSFTSSASQFRLQLLAALRLPVEERIPKLVSLIAAIDEEIRFDEQLAEAADAADGEGLGRDERSRLVTRSMNAYEHGELTALREEVERERAAAVAAIAEAAERKRVAEEEAKAIAAQQEKWDEERPDRSFELCLTGSLGFWVTVGLLAGWSQLRRRRHAGIHESSSGS